jgi:2-hydroxy-3-oxopropionate reductase
MSRPDQRVGFIGLGIMGKPMARNLMQAGYRLVVYSRSAPPVEELESEGATRAGDPAEVAANADVVITMLPDTPDVEQVLVDPTVGVIKYAREGHLVVDMSTIAPVATRAVAAELGAKGAEFLDAPVSGGERGAVDGTLSIMVGGEEDAFRRARPIFEVLGSNVVHVGSAGAGQVAKACNQLIVAANIESVAEALVLAAKAEVNPARVRTALLGGFAASKVLEVHGQRMLDRAFEPGFPIRLHRKDGRIIEETANEVGSPLPGFEPVVRQLQRMLDADKGELDHSALILALEAEAGIQVGPTRE